MTKKLSQEVRKEIHFLKEEGKSVKDILEILKSKGTFISDKTVYRILKEEKEAGSFVVSQFSEEDEFDFDDDGLFPSLREKKEEEKNDKEKKENEKEEEKNETENEKEKLIVMEQTEISLQDILKRGIEEGTQKVLSVFNKDITESNDKLDQIMKETKKKVNKPMNIKAIQNVYNTDGLTEDEKRIRRDLITKIRNYLDCFADNDIINELTGDKAAFKQSLYSKDLKTLTVIYEEIQIGLNSSKDYEQFINMFSTSLKCIEFVSNILLGISITGLQEEVLREIDEFDLKQLACELSLSRYISPQKRVMLVAVKILLKKVLSNDLLSANKDLKLKLYNYYTSISKFLTR